MIKEEKGPGTHCYHICRLLHGSELHFHSDRSKVASVHTVVWIVNDEYAVISEATSFFFFWGPLARVCDMYQALSPPQFKRPQYEASLSAVVSAREYTWIRPNIDPVEIPLSKIL